MASNFTICLPDGQIVPRYELRYYIQLINGLHSLASIPCEVGEIIDEKTLDGFVRWVDNSKYAVATFGSAKLDNSDPKYRRITDDWQPAW